MEFTEVVKNRRSIREYSDKPVPEDVLKRVLEAARIAPSGRNAQAWKFVVVRDAAKRLLLAQAANQPFIGQAPVIIAPVALVPDRLMMCGVPSYAVDMGIAMEHIVLAAFNEGLGTCWIGAFSQEKAREALGVPDKYKVVTVMPLGYPKQKPDARPRKSLEEIVCWNTFRE